jgi:hypothetical protein
MIINSVIMAMTEEFCNTSELLGSVWRERDSTTWSTCSYLLWVASGRLVCQTQWCKTTFWHHSGSLAEYEHKQQARKLSSEVLKKQSHWKPADWNWCVKYFCSLLAFLKVLLHIHMCLQNNKQVLSYCCQPAPPQHTKGIPYDNPLKHSNNKVISKK